MCRVGDAGLTREDADMSMWPSGSAASCKGPDMYCAYIITQEATCMLWDHDCGVHAEIPSFYDTPCT